ncbi:MAG: ribonuclease III [Candidatus Komeilibacteria bacterium]|nr:ribonuclease III [Candidatus Komeilibacteria bacterium]
MNKLEKLEQRLNVSFRDKDVLKSALVHRSYLNEHKSFPLDHNERLEFLGDAVLELIVTEYLYSNYPDPEGELTNWRSSLVNFKMLSARAEALDLYPLMYMSRGEARDQSPKARMYILANAYEAVIGALFVDQGLEAAKQFILKDLIPHFGEILEKKLYLDSKSKFQERSQEQLNITPRYKILKEIGPDHSKHFTVGVYLDKELIAEGTGMSKQEAETDAATNALREKQWD